MPEDIRLFNGDCLNVLPTLAAGSVDAVVTDPPYGLEFMGKDWDAPWKYRLSGFGFTDNKFRNVAPQFNSARNPMCRTCHKHKRGSKRHVACACPEPDFDETEHRLRDLAKYQAWCTEWAAAALRVLKPGGYLMAFGGTRTFHRLACALEDAGFEMRDTLCWLYATGFPKGKGCLKPAWEPVLLCRRPGPRVLPLGIEECRVPTNGECLSGGDSTSGPKGKVEGWDRPWMHDPEARAAHQAKCQQNVAHAEATGRWPANCTHDGSPEVMEAFAAFGSTSTTGKRSERSRAATVNGTAWGPDNHKSTEYANEPPGTAARFFYTAKASRAERGEGNNHPTVKPLALMRWLVKLACPAGGVVLDPFMGSGTTLVAAVQAGRRGIGIESDPGYFEIAQKRVAAARDAHPLFAEAL